MGERYWYTCAVCHFWYTWFRRPRPGLTRSCRECKQVTPWEPWGHTDPPK